MEVIAAAVADDAGSRAIAERASVLVHTHLCDAARRCYLHRLLVGYDKAMAYKPSPAYRPGAVRVVRKSELIVAEPRA